MKNKFMLPRFLKFDQVPLPIFKELKSKEFIYYGEKNDYPEYLLRLYNNSAKHNAIITGKVDYTCGSGWEVKGDSLIDRAKVYGIIDSINSTKESLNELTFKLSTDLFLFGGYYLQIIWSKATGEIAELYHIDYSKVRTNADNTLFFVSDEWIKNGSTNSRPQYETFPAFDPNNRTGTQILYFKEYRAGLNTYSLPDYRGSINYIELDISVSEYHLNSINNGLFSSKLINFPNGIVSEEEEARIEKMMNNKFAGSKNAGKFMLSFTDGGDKKPEVIDLSGTELDKHFDLLNKTIQQEIFAGAKITSPMLFGIKTEGQLGGRNELREASELFQNTYINAKQRSIEQIINYVYSFNDITAYLCLKEIEPIAFEFSETVITQNMTQEEIRERLSLPPIEKTEAAGSQDIINALNSLSPLIATKVVESMDINELRQLIGLAPKVDIKTPEEVSQTPPPAIVETIATECNHHEHFKDDVIIKMFEGKGKSKDNYHVIHSDKMNFSDDLKSELFAEYNLTNIQQLIIEQIKNNPLITKTEISEIAKLPLVVVDENLKALIKSGAVKESTKNVGGQKQIERSLSKDLTKQIRSAPQISQYEILYSYEERPNVPPAISGSRPLCQKLYSSNLFFTRKEIEDISRQLGYSVFLLCGGYYHNPNTGITTPYCRHFWQRNVVVKK
jgi:hypothetical protein